MSALRPTLLAAALNLAARGLPVFALNFPVLRRGTLVCSCGHRNCSNAAKHPFGSLVPHGVKDATTDQQQIEKWWRQYPQVNVGLSTASLVILSRHSAAARRRGRSAAAPGLGWPLAIARSDQSPQRRAPPPRAK
jgi:Bifunctional DNA primase/polymerase, N-terminal